MPTPMPRKKPSWTVYLFLALFAFSAAAGFAPAAAAQGGAATPAPAAAPKQDKTDKAAAKKKGAKTPKAASDKAAAPAADPPAKSGARGPATPPPGASPIDDLKQANARLKKAVGKAGPSWSPEADAKNAEVKKIVGELLDFEELGRRALAKHWDTLSTKQRAEFIATLRSLVERSYIRSVHGQPDYDLKFDKEETTGSESSVPATLTATRKGKKISMSLVYRLIWKEGRWVVYDVVTDDVSLLENYRAEFGKLISKEGFDGLMARMKKKLDEKSGG